MAIVSAVYEARKLIAIDVDGRRLCRVHARFFNKLPVSEGDAIDEAAYLDRLCALMLGACYSDALTLLGRSARASGELREKLIAKGYLEAAADAALERLIENRLVDDGEYARRAVELSENKPVGVYALRRKLKAKGVDEQALDEALALVDGESQIESARALAERLLPRYRKDPPRARRAKLSQALARRGFSWDAISAALDSLEGMEDIEDMDPDGDFDLTD